MLLKLTTIVVVFLVWAPVASAWSWPVRGPVLESFSYDEAHPYGAGQHRGIDIGANATGDPVVAPEGGTVSFAGFVPTSGESITIETADGYSVTLTHLGSIGVGKGATVAEGDVVATIGPSGTPEQSVPYLHLGVRLTADPLGYLDPLGLLPAPEPPSPTPAPTPAPKPVQQPVPARERPRGGGLVVKNPATTPTPVVVAPAQPVRAATPSPQRQPRPRPRPHRVHRAKPAGAESPEIRRPLAEPLVEPLMAPLWAGAPAAAEPVVHSLETGSRVLSVAPGIVAVLLALLTTFTRTRRQTPLPARLVAFRKEQPLRCAA